MADNYVGLEIQIIFFSHRPRLLDHPGEFSVCHCFFFDDLAYRAGASWNLFHKDRMEPLLVKFSQPGGLGKSLERFLRPI